MNTEQMIVAFLGTILIILSVMEYWKPEFKASL